MRTRTRRGIGGPAYIWRAWLPILAREAEPHGSGARLGARADGELSQGRRNVVVDSPLRNDEAVGDLRVREPLREQREYLQLARRQTGRVLARRGAGPSWETAHPTLAQPPSHDRRSRASAQPLQFGERAPQRLLIVGRRECERCLVGAADRRPGIGRQRPVAGELERVWLGSCFGRCFVEAGAPTPFGELAREPPRAPLPGEGQRVFGRGRNGLAVALKPGRLRPGCRYRAEPLAAPRSAPPVAMPRRAPPIAPDLRAALARGRARRAR